MWIISVVLYICWKCALQWGSNVMLFGEPPTVSLKHDPSTLFAYLFTYCTLYFSKTSPCILPWRPQLGTGCCGRGGRAPASYDVLHALWPCWCMDQKPFSAFALGSKITFEPLAACCRVCPCSLCSFHKVFRCLSEFKRNKTVEAHWKKQGGFSSELLSLSICIFATEPAEDKLHCFFLVLYTFWGVFPKQNKTHLNPCSILVFCKCLVSKTLVLVRRGCELEVSWVRSPRAKLT